jgi:hypothetical protein
VEIKSVKNSLAELVGAGNVREVRVHLLLPHVRWLIENSPTLPSNPTDEQLASAIGRAFDVIVSEADDQ